MSALVIGANGFLGSHVTRQLVAAGGDVRVMVRSGANTVSIDDLDVTRFVGDIFDLDTVRAAMAGDCDVVYYCVVDTRAWLRDPTPLFRTNVEGLRGVLDVALTSGLKKFVFTSSYSTVGRKKGRIATEVDQIERRGLTAYVRSRVQAEDLVLEYAKDRGLPAVAMCVASTYGRGDYGMTPPRRPDRRHGVRQDAVCARWYLVGGGRRRRRRGRAPESRRARQAGRAVPHLGADDLQRRGGAPRR